VLIGNSRSRRAERIAALALAGLFLASGPIAPGQVSADQSQGGTFRATANLVRVDVVVRDRSGNVVRGLTAADFLVTEDGRAQRITSFDFEEISVEALPSLAAPVPGVLGREQLQSAASRTSVTVAPSRPSGTDSVPEPSRGTNADVFAGRRLVVLLFDTSSMQPEEVDRAVKAAVNYVDTQMTVADLVAVASVGQTLTILRDFTSDRDLLKATLAAFDVTAGTGFEQPEVADVSAVTDDTDPADLPLDDSEFGIFNNDRRLRAMRVLAEALAPIEQKKAILYFSSGMSRSGSDNQVELRAVINAAVRANTAIYPVDSRGLTAVVPGGAAGGRGGGGRGGGGASVFSGRAMLSQFTSLNSSQETLTTLAEDTGGQAFLDTNDFGPAFTEVQRDMSAYYLLGYSSTNPAQDGKFRRITVRLRDTAAGYRVEARSGYYAEADFAHLRKEDKERQLQEQIASAVSLTDIPVVATTSWFRLANGRYYVPVSVAVPGSVLRVATDPKLDQRNASLDLLGVVTDEQGRSVGRIRDTMQIPAAQVAVLENRQVQYQSGVTLPAGRFKVKVAVRENADGTMGTFEFPITIPDLVSEPIRVSPVVLSTQLRSVRGGGPGGRGGGGRAGRPGGPGPGGPPPPGPGFTSQRGGGGPQWSDGNSVNPLLRSGQEIVQSLSHIVLTGQQMYFYYEVYEPALDAKGLPRVRSSLAFYRGRVKVFETPIVDRAAIDDAARRAVVFQLQVAASGLKPGLYTCQVNVIDEISGRFAFPRLAVYVKEPAPAAPPGSSSEPVSQPAR
jgi:VWFA-related protein